LEGNPHQAHGTADRLDEAIRAAEEAIGIALAASDTALAGQISWLCRWHRASALSLNGWFVFRTRHGGFGCLKSNLRVRAVAEWLRR